MNQGMGAVIFSAGVTQARSVLIVEQLFQRFLLLLRHYLRRPAATGLPLHAQGCQDPVNCSRVRFRLESGLPKTFFHDDDAYSKTVQHARGVLAVPTPSSIELTLPSEKKHATHF